MPHIALCLLVAVGIALPAAASNVDSTSGPVTFYEHVLPILQENCQVCHRPNGANLGGMVAPMAFTSYEETRPWAKSIARKVEAREMPPWHASPAQDGVFRNQRTLDEAEIDTLVGWAKTGARAGDPEAAPPARQFPSSDGWLIGEPDLIVSMPEPYLVPDDVEDQYVTFTSTITKEMLPEPRWVKGVEFRPGSPVVHHIIAPPLGGIAPGNDPTIYDDGYGTLLRPGTTVSWQMHYHKEPGAGTAVTDQSLAAIKLYPKGYRPQHVIQSEPLGNLRIEIPAGAANHTEQASFTFERDSLILGYTPHMHLRGKSAQYVAFYPDGHREVLLEVPRYDFNWQTTYRYDEVKPVPAGTRIELTMAWDNSADNPYNPDPTETVRFGRPTTAEMMFGFMSYVDAEPGYVPPRRGGLLGGGGRRSPEELKAMVKERFGIDLDELTPEERRELFERFRQRRSGSSGE